MSDISAAGSTLQSALEAAVAALVATDASNVTVRVDAPGAHRVAGDYTIDLRIGAAEEPEDDEPDDREQRDERGASAGGAERDAKAERKGPRAGDDDGSDEYVVSPEELDEEADAAADFIEGLLDALDLPGDLRISIHPDHAEIEIVDIGSGALIGRRGQTLEAIQELVRCTLQRQFQRRARVKIDAEGYRTRRLEKLIEKAEEAIDAVLDTGEPERLEPMDVFERKTVHQLVAEVDGLESHSQGREPARRVVIERA